MMEKDNMNLLLLNLKLDMLRKVIEVTGIGSRTRHR